MAAPTVKIKGQQTHNLSFRSGFSLEPGDTRVSLNTHTHSGGGGVSWGGRRWQWPDLLHQSTEIKNDLVMTY